MNHFISIWLAIVLCFYWFNLVWTVPCSNINNTRAPLPATLVRTTSMMMDTRCLR